MKKLILMGFLTLALLALVIGCGQKEDTSQDATPEATQQAENMDHSAMDSAQQMADSVMADTTMMHDSM